MYQKSPKYKLGIDKNLFLLSYKIMQVKLLLLRSKINYLCNTEMNKSG